MDSVSSFRGPVVGDASPWDRIQHVREVAPGIVSVDTAGHGGYWLSPQRVADMRARVPHLLTPSTFYPLDSAGQWFEEDCECCRVVLAFPDLFPDGARDYARGYAQHAGWIARPSDRGASALTRSPRFSEVPADGRSPQ